MEKHILKKSVSSFEAMCIVVGMIIGSGIFLKPGIVLQSAGSPLLSILAWVAGGIVTLASALSIAEIASAMPETGGLYIYLQRLYGDVWGYLLGWVQAVVSYPASVAAQAIAFASYFSIFVPLSSMQQKLMAIVLLLFILAMNILSTKYGSVIQTAATIGKLIPVAGIVIFGLTYSGELNFSAVSQATATGFGAAILGTLWAYDGWIGVTNMAGEMKNHRHLPRVIAIGVIFVTVVYALFNLALFKALPPDHVAGSATPGVEAATVLFGSGGATFITVGIMVSVLGALNGYLMTSARVPLAMGQKGQLPFSSFLGAVHPKFGTPANALIMQSILAIIYILSGSFNTITDLLIFVLWIFFTMGVFGVFIMRKKYPGLSGGYKVPLYPVTPVVGIIGSVYILVSTVFTSPVSSFIGIGIALLGLPVYYYIKKKS